eukprot:1160451-Pelagomonas_calceolata.AAC.19
MVNCLQVSPSNSSPQRQQRQQFRHAFASLTSDSLDSWDFDDHHQGLPGPSNTPTQEDDEGEELLYAPRRDIDMWMLTDQPGIDLLLAGPGALEHLQQIACAILKFLRILSPVRAPASESGVLGALAAGEWLLYRSRVWEKHSVNERSFQVSWPASSHA